MGLAWLVAVLALLVPGIAVLTRRLHDTGRSGWWQLIGFIPLGGLVLLVFAVQDSAPDNAFGPSPKGSGGFGQYPGQPQYPATQQYPGQAQYPATQQYPGQPQ